MIDLPSQFPNGKAACGEPLSPLMASTGRLGEAVGRPVGDDV
jgi:hypothetical protein